MGVDIWLWLARAGAVLAAAWGGWEMARAQFRQPDHETTGSGAAEGCAQGGCWGMPDDGLSCGCCIAALLLQFVSHAWMGLLGLVAAFALAAYGWTPQDFANAWYHDPLSLAPYAELLDQPVLWVPLGSLAVGFVVARLTDPMARQ